MLSNEIKKVTGHTTFVGTHSKEKIDYPQIYPYGTHSKEKIDYPQIYPYGPHFTSRCFLVEVHMLEYKHLIYLVTF